MVRRTCIFLILLACGVAAVLAVLLWPRPEPEPVYGGKKLSQWLVMYYVGPQATREEKEEARKAIQHIGTNAMPFVLKWFQYAKPKWQLTVARSTPYWFPLGKNAKDILSQAATCSFEILGTNAAIAIPELKQLMLESKSAMVSNRALYAMCHVGDFSCLLTLLEQPGRVDRGLVISSMTSRFGTNGSAAATNVLRRIAR